MPQTSGPHAVHPAPQVNIAKFDLARGQSSLRSDRDRVRRRISAQDIERGSAADAESAPLTDSVMMHSTVRSDAGPLLVDNRPLDIGHIPVPAEELRSTDPCEKTEILTVRLIGHSKTSLASRSPDLDLGHPS